MIKHKKLLGVVLSEFYIWAPGFAHTHIRSIMIVFYSLLQFRPLVFVLLEILIVSIKYSRMLWRHAGKAVIHVIMCSRCTTYPH